MTKNPNRLPFELDPELDDSLITAHAGLPLVVEMFRDTGGASSPARSNNSRPGSARSGTIEHVHHVVVNELAGGWIRSTWFGAKAGWFRANTILYNLLPAPGRLTLPEEFANARPKRLRFVLFNVVGRVVSHARERLMKISAQSTFLRGFRTGSSRSAGDRRVGMRVPRPRGLARTGDASGGLLSLRRGTSPDNCPCRAGVHPV